MPLHLHLLLIILYCTLFAFTAGLIYGIFGGGSGLIMVPGFYYLIHHFAMITTAAQMQMAIATTAAATALLGLFATWVQYRAQHIDYKLIKQMSGGLLIGVLVAVILLNIVPSHFLKKLFSIMVMGVAIWLWCYRQEKDANPWPLATLRHHIMSTLIALFWFLLGVAVFTVPYLQKCGINIRRSVGSATLISTLFSVLAALLLIATGLFKVGASPLHWGYVNVLIVAIAVIPSGVAAYIGSHISVRLPQKHLKRYYAGLIFIIALLMLL